MSEVTYIALSLPIFHGRQIKFQSSAENVVKTQMDNQENPMSFTGGSTAINDWSGRLVPKKDLLLR